MAWRGILILLLFLLVLVLGSEEEGTCSEEKRQAGKCGGEAATEAPKCGSCYGAEDPQKGIRCCDTCEEVQRAYKEKKWKWVGNAQVEQCKGLPEAGMAQANQQQPVAASGGACESNQGCTECLANGCAWCIGTRRCAKDEPWMCQGEDDHIGRIGTHKQCPSRQERDAKRNKRLEEETKAREEAASRLVASGAANGEAGGQGMDEARKRAAQKLRERQEEELEKIRHESEQQQDGGESSADARRESDEVNRAEIERRAKEVGAWETKPYEVLAVETDCGAKDLKKAYRKLSLMLHPDKIFDAALRELAKIAFMDVVAAYEILGDPDKRAAFDDMGGEDQAQFHTYWEWKQYGGGTKAKDFYTGDKLISKLTESLWPRRVTGNKIWLVEFYTPWCSACGTFVPVFKDIAKMLEDDDIEVGAVNCEANKAVCSEWFSIPSYPALMLVGSADHGAQQTYGQGKSKGVQDVVDWARLIAKEWTWLFEHSKVDVIHSDQEFEQQILDSEDLWFVVFTDGLFCGPCRTAMTNALRLDAALNGLAKVAAVDCEEPKNHELCFSRMGVPSPPHAPQVRIYRKGKKDAKSAPGYTGEVLFNANEIAPQIALQLTERVARHALADEIPSTALGAGTIGDFQSDDKQSTQPPPPQWNGPTQNDMPQRARVGGGGMRGGGRPGIGR